MPERRHPGRRCALLAIVLGACLHDADAQDDANFRFSGYYKNQLSHSTTLFPSQESYNLDLNRLRLQVQGQLNPVLGLEIQYDNELVLGSYLRSRQFDLQKEMRPSQFWKMESNTGESSDVYARHRIYRGFVTVSAGDTDVRIGRQRIAWGTGRFWSPLDLLNPISPIQLERNERPGVDAVLVEKKLGDLSRISAAYAPQHERAASSAALYWHGNTAGIDFSVVVAKFAGNQLLGGDIATQIGDAGLRAEFTYTVPGTEKNYRRILAALDYAFANTLTLSAELYYNGAGASDARAYDFTALFSGRVQSLGRRYIGIFASYEITPLLKTQHYVVVNLRDRSRYYSPSLTYSLRTNVDWTSGAQLFAGNTPSEYGRLNNLFYTQVQWFF